MQSIRNGILATVLPTFLFLHSCSSDGDWSVVRHIKSGRTGAVPRRYLGDNLDAYEDEDIKEYFAGRIERKDAVRLIEEHKEALPDGAYLLRESAGTSAGRRSNEHIFSAQTAASSSL